MSEYYSYTLDGVNYTDPIIGIDGIRRTITRNWNGTSSDNILRKSLTGTLTFTGNAYNYICAKIKNGYCEIVNVEIFGSNGNLFYAGTIHGYMGKINVTKRTIECELKDTSWSSLLRNRTNQEVWVRSERTIGCEPIERARFRFVEFYDVNTGNPLPGYRLGFNVLELLEYLARYLTDNQVGVVSNYLQNVEFGIYTSKVLNTNNITAPGFFSTLTDEEIYPVISFDALFEELRKKTALYIGVEYTLTGVQLRIEPESYFFSNTTGLTFPILPYDTNLSVDIGRLNSVVKVGQADTELSDTPIITFPQRKYFAWEEDVYNSCSCESDKDNELDLISDFIIDTNLINEALFQNAEFDNLFLIHTNFQLPFSNAILTQNTQNSLYYYNDILRNPNVIERWSNYFVSCLYSARQSGITFELECNPPLSGTFCIQAPPAGNTTYGFTGYLTFGLPEDEISDSENAYPELLPLVNPLIPNSVTASYKIPVEAYYIFEAQCFWNLNVGADVDYARASISIVVYSDNTATTEIYRKTETAEFFNTNDLVNVQLYVLSDFILLPPGACVVPEVNSFILDTSTISVAQTFQRDFFRFSEEINCFNLPNENLNYPYVYEFDAELCDADFEYLDNNMKSKIQLGNIDGWISEVSQDIKGFASFKLLSNQNICCDE